MLDPGQIEKLEVLLQSSAWNEVIKPVLEARAHHAIKNLVLSPSERADEFKTLNDDAIRARIRECEWMLKVWGNEVVVAQHNRRRDELDRQRQNGVQPLAANP